MRTQSIAAIRGLLTDDLFEQVRTDEALAALVEETAARERQPYRVLLERLIGAPNDLDEDVARDLWLCAVEHRRNLRELVLRPVHLRVAILDLLAVDPRTWSVRPLVMTKRLATSVAHDLGSDALTGLMNREHFVLVLEHELRRRQRTRAQLVLLDLDGFKAVNDTFGHQRGDQVLRAFGDACRQVARAEDVFARLGGDEFVAYLPQVDAASAHKILQRIGQAFADATGDVQVGFSHGLAAMSAEATLASLLTDADQAMYANKKERKLAQLSSAHTKKPTSRKTPTHATSADTANAPARKLEQPVVAVLVATTSPTLFLNVQTRLAKRGYVAIPAHDVRSATSLYRLVHPAAVLADFLFPPDGGDALLSTLGIRRDNTSGAVLATRTWPGASAARALRHPLLRLPRDIEVPAPHALAGFPQTVVPVDPLEDVGEARALMAAVAKVMDGKRLADAVTDRVGRRPALALVRAHMGH